MNMASSDIIKYHKEERFNLKRTRDRSVESSNKKLRMCERTGYFLEVRSKKMWDFLRETELAFGEVVTEVIV